MRKYLIAAVSAVLVLSMATVALAIHDFTDVPDSHPFHDEISSMAAAGITTGYADGTFRPSDNVTRQAMSAFMQRGFGRLYFDGVVDSSGTIDDPIDSVFGTSNPILVAATGIVAGATGGGQGYVLLEGNVRIFGDVGCPCIAIVEIIDFSGATLGWTYEQIGDEEVKNISLQGADTLPADTGDIFFIRVTQFFGLNGDTIQINSDLSSLYVPFDLDAGNDTLFPPAAAAGDLATTPSLDASALEGGAFDIGDVPAMTSAQRAAFEAAIPAALKP